MYYFTRIQLAKVLAVAALFLLSPPLTRGQAPTGDPVGVDQITWVNPPEALPPNTKHDTFWSPSMDLEVGYSIYLPPGYEEGVARYPVVYWLHGRGGNEAGVSPIPVLHAAIQDGRAKPIVFVIVNGGVASGYIDNPTTGVMGESVVVRELIPHIEGTYRVGSNAASRGIGGMSMGGAGAVRMALRYPEMFGVVVSVAGALLDYASIMERHWVPDAALARSYDPYVQASRQAVRLHQSLSLRMFIGTNDGQLNNNRRFNTHLDDLGVPCEYTQLEGIEHNLSQYLNAVGLEIFGFYSAHLVKPD